MMQLQDYIDSQQPETVRARKYEEECSKVTPGHLTPTDVCRLWDSRPYRQWSAEPAASAKRLVVDLGLPLMELGSGRWVVIHALEGLELPHE